MLAIDKDASGFLYTRYPAGDEYHRMVYAHTLGADWHDDRRSIRTRRESLLTRQPTAIRAMMRSR